MASRRLLMFLCVLGTLVPAAAVAQTTAPSDLPDPPAALEPESDASEAGSPFDPESYVALSADQEAQESLGGFRRYLERTREADDNLYRLLDTRLDDLEERETAADVVFWTATGLAAGALIAAIPVHETLGLDPALAFVIAGGGTFLLGVIIQAILRPSHGDLVDLIDLHDQRLGRR